MTRSRFVCVFYWTFLVIFFLRVYGTCYSPKGWEYVSDYPVEMYGASAASVNGSLYLLGNSYNNEYVQDAPLFDRLWILDGDSLQWSWKITSGDIPIRRHYYCTRIINDQIYLFGGRIATTNRGTDALHSLDLRSLSWTKIEPSSSKNPPKNMYMSCFPFQDKILVYGGYAGYFESTELWSFDTRSRKWELLVPSSEELLNYPTVFNPYGAIFQEVLFLFAGSTTYYSPEGYYDNSPTMWRYNITKKKWYEPIEIKGISGALFGSVSVHENMMYIFGGAQDASWKSQSNSLSVINLETFEWEEIQSSEFNYDAKYPILTPSPRVVTSSFVYENMLIIFGGGYSNPQNDFWVFDTKSRTWVDSSLSRYPLGRANPHITKVSDTKIAVFGGDICPYVTQPTNDLWLLNTSNHTWERIEQESDCHPSNSNCAPPVQNAAFGYWNETLYLIGGYLKAYDNPIMKKYSLERRIWYTIEKSEDDWFGLGLRFNSANMVFGSKVFIWGGKNANGSTGNSDLFIFKMDYDSLEVRKNSTNTPPTRPSPKGIIMNINFCFYDTSYRDSPSLRLEIWCFMEDKDEWEKVATMPPEIVENSIIAFKSNFMAFGGSGQTNSKKIWMGNILTSAWGTSPLFIDTFPGRLQSSLLLERYLLIIFGGKSSNGITNGLYNMDIRKMFCDGHQTISSDNQTVTDGSGEYSYFPGTNCSWSITRTNFLVIEYMNVTTGASLTLFQTERCAGGFLLNGDKTLQKIHLESLVSGDVIEVVSGDVNLSFQVDEDAETSDGFSIRLFDCNLGFTARLSGCVCESGKYITFRGECISCPDNFYQSAENQTECIPIAIEQPHEKLYLDLDSIKQTESMELSQGLLPIIFANSAVINSTIYVIGGSLSSDVKQTQLYHSMNYVYVATSAVNSVWRKIRVEGEIPSRRIHSCLVSMGSYAVLIGGKAESSDNFVYFFDPAERKWTRKSKLPRTLIGAQCTERKETIFIYGGLDESGNLSNSIFTYSPESDIWKEKEQPEVIIHRSYGSLLFRNDGFVLYGGEYEKEEPEGMLYYSQDFKHIVLSQISLINCTSCDEEGDACFFGRKHFSYAVFGNELHVFGGMRKGEVLEDVFIIDLDTQQVVHRKNYGHTLPDLPLEFPPPKFGSAFVTYGSKLVLIGGATSIDNVVNDVWVWDAELRTWVDTSVLREPISRKEPGFSIFDDNSFVMFGGSTHYFDEVLLNDLWMFNIGTRAWSLLFLGSLESGPSARAGAIVSVHSSRIFVSGGRTDTGVFDDRVWAFNLGTKEWESINIENKLSSFQRPLSRFGIRATQIEGIAWMWGGQISPGTRKVEFYSAVIGFDIEKNKIYSNKIIGATPPRRTYHSLCSIDSSSFSIFGGLDVNGNPLNDHWIYNTTSQTWKSIQYVSSDINLSLYGHACSSFDGFMILNGKETNGDASYWMQQHDFKTISKTLVSNKIPGHESMTYHSSAMMKGLVVTFGGKNDYMTSNRVVAYRPGFCSLFPSTIESDISPSRFDDGSGTGMYLEGTNCTWILPSATHLVLQRNIRDSDNIEIRSISGDDVHHLPDTISSMRYDKRDVLTSKTGFLIRFTTKATTLSSNNKPCFDCEGFNITHARCPPHSHLDIEKNECTCESGYQMKNENCLKETRINYYSIVGGTVGGLLFVVLAGAYFYRKRMMENVKGSEKKLYGIIDPNELNLGRLLGSGSFGDVYKGDWRGAEVAIKVLKNTTLSSEQINAFKSEISVMVELRHPNILLYMGASLDVGNMCLVCEYMHQGSLYDVLHSDKQILFLKRLQFMSDISKGMQYLHASTPPILHRDLKSLNILVDDRDRLKVSDFGLTTIQGNDKTNESLGSLLWLAPEVIGGQEYTTQADVYSFGIIAWEIMSRKIPYHDIENVYAVMLQVTVNETRPTMPENVPEDVQIIIRNLWAQNPTERLPFQQVSSSISNLMETSRQLSSSSFMDAIDVQDRKPPQGSVCIVCTCISGSDRLWDEIPDSMADGVLLQMKTLKEVSKKYQGYLSQNDGENMTVVFQDIIQAIRFAAESQVKLNEAEWTSELLQHENCMPIADGQLKGLRVKMGIDFGLCSSNFDETSGRETYTGKCVISAKKMSRNCHGGQIILSESVIKELDEGRKSLEKDFIISQTQQDGSSRSHIFYEICPRELSKRIEFLQNLQWSQMQPIEHTLSTNSHYENLPNMPVEVSQSVNAEKNQGAGDTESSFKNETKIQPNKRRLQPLGEMATKLKSWEISIKDLSIQQKSIGAGSYGCVYPGEYKGKKVAIKKINNGGGNQSDRTVVLFYSEVSVLRKLRHPNIIEFIGACTNPPNLAIIMELVEPGNLRQLLLNSSAQMDDAKKTKIINGIVKGMAYLHSHSPAIIHRDLNSSNVLVNQMFESKLCDFGFSRVKANNRTMTKCGTIAYQAPEVMKGERYNEKADVYSFGIVLWEIETRQVPYQGKDPLALQFEVIKGLRPELKSGMNQKKVELIQRCWHTNPESRPCFSDLEKRSDNTFELGVHHT